MRKGNKCIYQGQIYEVWKKDHNHVIIFNPGAAAPELTFISTSINNIKKA